MDNFKWYKLHVSVAVVRLRKKMFRNSGWFGFNVSFVNWASMFVESLRRRLVSPRYCKW